jgi:hypothetical protein
MVLKVISKVQPNLTITNSTSISHIPLVNKNHDTFLILFLRAPYRKAEVPAKKTNIGAQKWVIHLVKKRNGVVVCKSVGFVKKEP